jgi:hypothetical protein
MGSIGYPFLPPPPPITDCLLTKEVRSTTKAGSGSYEPSNLGDYFSPSSLAICMMRRMGIGYASIFS